MKDNGIKQNDTNLSKGMSIGMCIGIVIGIILGFAIWRTGTAMCLGGSAGDIIGAAIGGFIGSKKDKAEKEDNAEA